MVRSHPPVLFSSLSYFFLPILKIRILKLYYICYAFFIFQSIKVSLRGLEHAFQHVSIFNALHKLLLEKSLYAEVKEWSADGNSVVLWDTSSREDVNINEELIQLLPDKFTKPKLPTEVSFFLL